MSSSAPSTSSAAPISGLTPTFRHAWRNRTAPYTPPVSVMARAGISSSAARMASSAGCEPPSRNEKLEWQCSSTYGVTVQPSDLRPESETRALHKTYVSIGFKRAFCAKRAESQSAGRAQGALSIVDPLEKPFVGREVEVQLAQQVVVEHGLPVLADDRPVPPRRLDLPADDRIDRPGEGARDGNRRAAVVERDIDQDRWFQQPRHLAATPKPSRSTDVGKVR